ncbi:class I SAM-dependent methyltransferase [Neptuniibacter halophilus]|uniref:class I SAM-dependent methyltransferase n=1 Tax=Neptuniibacter halophilus TaxID=651666 RepID=UPI0025726618|nr:class I SAM-dependent methyltransferase [Neptuniibacter halophilus]
MTGQISQHYQQQLQREQILSRVQQTYPQGPNLYQLAPVDQLHIGGIKASEKLLQRIEQLRPRRILDIGSGTGGLMRLLQSKLDTALVGVDISHELNRLNRDLTALCPEQTSPRLITADAHHLPFADQQFDLILFQHSLLNMPDSRQVLSESRRLLLSDGQLLLHEVLAGDQPEKMRYPVPWARDAAHSHLLSEPRLRKLLQESGFELYQFDDWSAEALAWRQRQSEKEKSQQVQAAPLSPALILGSDFSRMGANVMANLSSGAARVVEVLAQPC